MREQFNLVKELADMQNKAIGREAIAIVSMPKRKKDNKNESNKKKNYP